MPRGKYTNHKGRNRKFTSPEELEEERKKEQKKGWRSANRDLPPSDSEESDENEKNESDDSEGDSEDDALKKSKGVEGMIEVENPNRIQKKVKKVETLNVAATGQPQLTRKEREELERQRAAQHYQKLHAEGKTDEARADLARLAIIKQQREEAAKKRELQIKEKEMAKQSKTAEIHKAIGKN